MLSRKLMEINAMKKKKKKIAEKNKGDRPI